MKNVPSCPICKSENTQYHTSKSDMYWCKNCNADFTDDMKVSPLQVLSSVVYRALNYLFGVS